MLKRLSLCSAFILLTTLSANVFAWRNEMYAGFGYGRELSRHYKNWGGIAGVVLSKFKLDSKLSFLFDTSGAYWRATGGTEKSIFAYAVSAAFRAYFIDPRDAPYRPFVQVTVGPSYMSKKELGSKNNGSKFSIQSRFGVGCEIGSESKSIMIGLQYIHYGNFGLKKPNQGINIPFVLTIGYAV